jgi:hypothetical protein
MSDIINSIFGTTFGESDATIKWEKEHKKKPPHKASTTRGIGGWLHRHAYHPHHHKVPHSLVGIQRGGHSGTHIQSAIENIVGSKKGGKGLARV